jgi:hypothetical protein
MCKRVFAAEKTVRIAETIQTRGPAHPGAPVRAPFRRPCEAAFGRVTQYCAFGIGHGMAFRRKIVWPSCGGCGKRGSIFGQLLGELGNFAHPAIAGKFESA